MPSGFRTEQGEGASRRETAAKAFNNREKSGYPEYSEAGGCMSAIPFDTLAYSSKLQNAGIAHEQAKAMANAQAEAMKDVVTAY